MSKVTHSKSCIDDTVHKPVKFASNKTRRCRKFLGSLPHSKIVRNISIINNKIKNVIAALNSENTFNFL